MFFPSQSAIGGNWHIQKRGFGDPGKVTASYRPIRLNAAKTPSHRGVASNL
jgi:hypothetical protein